MSRFVVCYDVASDRRRRQVAACLDTYGDRVQNSVFELPVDRKLIDRCLNELSSLIDPEDDRVAVYRLCSACEPARLYLGVDETVAHIGEEILFIV